MGAKTRNSPRCEHRGEEVRVGPYTVLAGGSFYLQAGDLGRADIIVPLTTNLNKLSFGERYDVLWTPLPDFGGVPPFWKDFLLESVVPLLQQGNLLLAFCAASHGRTGTFLASLIALLESAEETPDPIQAVRTRHCVESVESQAQAKAIFALRGQRLPDHYERKFAQIERLTQKTK